MDYGIKGAHATPNQIVYLSRLVYLGNAPEQKKIIPQKNQTRNRTNTLLNIALNNKIMHLRC